MITGYLKRRRLAHWKLFDPPREQMIRARLSLQLLPNDLVQERGSRSGTAGRAPLAAAFLSLHVCWKVAQEGFAGHRAPRYSCSAFRRYPRYRWPCMTKAETFSPSGAGCAGSSSASGREATITNAVSEVDGAKMFPPRRPGGRGHQRPTGPWRDQSAQSAAVGRGGGSTSDGSCPVRLPPPEVGAARISADANQAARILRPKRLPQSRCALVESNHAFAILATGLGKTVVAGEVSPHDHLSRTPEPGVSPFLIVAHLKELVQQLERATWRHLPR